MGLNDNPLRQTHPLLNQRSNNDPASAQTGIVQQCLLPHFRQRSNNFPHCMSAHIDMEPVVGLVVIFRAG